MPDNPLQTHTEERDALLARTLRLLEADDRVVAAWLHGSIGRGTHDDWSDIDLWIVVADEHMETVGAEGDTFVRSLGEPLLTLAPPQNAPPGGEYLLALYPGEQGPQMLDCSWQPQSLAQRPPDTRLLFDRVGIPPAEESELSPEDERLVMARQQIDFFWMMATVVAKYIARGQAWEVLALLRFVWTVLAGVEFLSGERASLPDYHDAPPFAPPLDPAEQLAALHFLVDQMQSLASRVPSLREGANPATPEQVLALLALVEQQLP
jgi:hypothetical protein